MIKKYLFTMLLLCSLSLVAQEHFPKNDGVKTTNTNYTAFTNAKIYVTPSQIIDKGTLLIKDGKVVSVGTAVNIPKNAVTIDVSGKSIYPSFIEVYSDFGVKKPERQGGGGRSSQYDATREGFYWNDHIMPEQNAIDHFKYDAKSASALRKAGFGMVNTHMQDGIIRGTGALIALTDEGGDANRIVNTRSGQYLSLSKSVASRQTYPNSIMGALALLRQVDLDAQWYANGGSKVTDRSLEAYNENKNLVQIMEAGSRANDMRVDKVSDDIGMPYVVVGGGDEYERIDDIKSTNATYIIPLDFPDAYDVEDTFLASTLELEAMREWNQRPANPKILSDNNVPFALTTHKLKSPSALNKNVMNAITYGLSKTKALEALTTMPAKILGMESTIGNLNEGAYANFLITSGDVFDSKTTLHENWVKGNRNILKSMDVIDINGDYTFTTGGKSYTLSVSGSSDKPKASIKTGGLELGTKIAYSDNWMNLTFSTPDTDKQEFMRLAAKVVGDKKDIKGKLIMPNGNEMPVVLKKSGNSDKGGDSKNKKDNNKAPKIMPVTYPNGAYGFSTLPKQETILFKNATVWTNEADGILENTDVLIKDGKISKIGSNLSAGGAKVVDATGKHLTSGIIDEHSHIALDDVNEVGHNSTAEVTMEDAINADDINIYRNLSGGVTGMQLLHGSANPIGGRSAIIKLKWGASAQNLIDPNGSKFIKFALGENVKQSRSQNPVRFPRSRMGVEQLYVDYFTRAQEYDVIKKSGEPYREDIEMEVLAEILNGERYISCHSYVQSEINMLMKVAEQFDFRVNTFTHILEGYKVADKMAEHGVGGSTFSDWWAYKYEVNDAIPYNAAIMHNAGVVVAINSDDREMSRRLNQEAAKTIKYGGLSEEDAWKTVTLNPAKLLHLDDRVGSIKIGKDADVVLWNGHPMSVYTMAEKTLIEGTVYFDMERDKQMRETIKKEKNELMTMMLQEKNKGVKTQPVKKQGKDELHCESINFNN